MTETAVKEPTALPADQIQNIRTAIEPLRPLRLLYEGDEFENMVVPDQGRFTNLATWLVDSLASSAEAAYEALGIEHAGDSRLSVVLPRLDPLHERVGALMVLQDAARARKPVIGALTTGTA